jgi:Multiprotein bridging factor 1
LGEQQKAHQLSKTVQMSQDWETVTLAKGKPAATRGAKNAAVNSALRTGTLQTEKKFAAGENKSAHGAHMNAKKLDEDTDNLKRECAYLLLSLVCHICRVFCTTIKLGRQRIVLAPVLKNKTVSHVACQYATRALAQRVAALSMRQLALTARSSVATAAADDRVDKGLAQALQQARLGKKITQRQLATMINEKPQVRSVVCGARLSGVGACSHMQLSGFISRHY